MGLFQSHPAHQHHEDPSKVFKRESEDNTTSESDEDEENNDSEYGISDSSSEDEIHDKHPGIRIQRSISDGKSPSDSLGGTPDKPSDLDSVFGTLIAEMEKSSQISLDCTTDAVHFQPIPLTLENVQSIETKLDLYEKVSLIYLLLDNAHFALQKLTLLLAGQLDRVIFDWANYYQSLNENWQDKMVEALCIIQNYQVLIALGYDKTDLMQRFLPNHSFTSLAVNKQRKVLYHICEALNNSDTIRLIYSVEKDFSDKNLPNFKHFHSNSFIEVYFLHWETLGYIKMDDVSNLYGVLKQMEKFDLCDKIQVRPQIPRVAQNLPTMGAGKDENTFAELGVPLATTPITIEKKSNKKLERAISNNKTVDNISASGSNRDRRFEQLFDPEVGLADVMNMDESSIVSDLNRSVSLESSMSSNISKNFGGNNSDSLSNSISRYSIDPENPGVVLIINQENFYFEIQSVYKELLAPNRLNTRSGTSKDKEVLIATFKSYGFDVRDEDNLTHTEMIDTITKCVKSITKESSLFVCIMSHGEQGVVYGVNSCKVDVTQIQDLMCKRNLKNLLGKPKVLILQSCQGTKCQKLPTEDDFEMDSPNSRQAVPTTTDMLTFWATVPGYGAIRHKRSGSWFIQSLCEKIKDLSHSYHLEDICTQIKYDVSRRTWNMKTTEENSEDVAMVPYTMSTMSKHFYLPARRL